MFSAFLEGSITREVLLVVVTDIRSGHVLVLDAGDALADLLALHVQYVTEHTHFTEVLLRQSIGRQRGRVIGRQRDQVMEDTRLASRICLEGTNLPVGFMTQLGFVVFNTH